MSPDGVIYSSPSPAVCVCRHWWYNPRSPLWRGVKSNLGCSPLMTRLLSFFSEAFQRFGPSLCLHFQKPFFFRCTWTYSVMITSEILTLTCDGSTQKQIHIKPDGNGMRKAVWLAGGKQPISSLRNSSEAFFLTPQCHCKVEVMWHCNCFFLI